MAICTASFICIRKEDTDQNRFQHWNEKIADDPAWEKAIVDGEVKGVTQFVTTRFGNVLGSNGSVSR